MRYVDAHMHLDLMEQPDAYLRRAVDAQAGLFSCTVEPQAYHPALDGFGGSPYVRVGLGLHPWWVAADPAQAQEQLDSFLQQVPAASFVGEVGLDFSPKHEATAQAQMAALRAILEACASLGGKVVSVHCVKAYPQLFDLLQQTGALGNNAIILHWFSGAHDQLLQAREWGCFFSVGERMLSAKRGRAYLKDMPINKLLLETDAPPEGAGIRQAFSMVADLLGQRAAKQTTENGCALFGFGL